MKKKYVDLQSEDYFVKMGAYQSCHDCIGCGATETMRRSMVP